MLTIIATLYGTGSLFWGVSAFLDAQKDNTVTVTASFRSGVFTAVFWPFLLMVAVVGLIRIMRGK